MRHDDLVPRRPRAVAGHGHDRHAGTGNRYILDIAWDVQPTTLRYYGFEGLGDFGQPITPPYLAGPFRVIDGKNGPALAADNFVLAHFQANAIPEPSTLALLGLGLGGAFLVRRRTRSTRG